MKSPTVKRLEREIRREQMHDRITLAICIIFLSSIAGAVATLFLVITP